MDVITYVRGLLARHDSGGLPRSEVLDLLVQAASSTPPEELAPALPEDWLEEIRNGTASPPPVATPLPFLSGVLRGPDYDDHPYHVALRRRRFEGAWNWSRFFGDSARAPSPGVAAPKQPG